MSDTSAGPHLPPVLALPFGDFGHAAATRLSEMLPSVQVLPGATQGGTEALLRNRSAIAVLVTWRPIPAISELLDARSFSTCTPFLSLALQDDYMVVGPIVVPGRGSCWRCWAARTLQCSPLRIAMQQRTAYYADHPLEGPKGYLPSLAHLGACHLVKALQALQFASAPAGIVLRISLSSLHTTQSLSVGLDDCSRCGLHRSLQTRSYRELKLGLESLWTWDDRRMSGQG
jgi:bacteriocin biosynthesis cyclodehydratase domain-containing protein